MIRREDFDGETLKVRRTAHEGTIEECRLSYVTHLRAAGINDADLAGHRVETMLARCTHALGGSHETVRNAID